LSFAASFAGPSGHFALLEVMRKGVGLHHGTSGKTRGDGEGLTDLYRRKIAGIRLELSKSG
jgi:hypothetical protein